MLAGGDIRFRPASWLVLALGTGGLLACGAAVAAALAAVHRTSTGTGEFALGGLHFTYPYLNTGGALLFALTSFGAAGLTVAGHATWRQFWRYRHFRAQLGSVGPLERDPRVSVIADPRPQAFCAGYLRPGVYVSRRAVELLSEDELDAVLAHEHHHRRVRDPLRLACGRILSEALFFLPALRPLCVRSTDEAELAADHAAICASGGQGAPLASALLAFDASAPAGASGISPERVDMLLGGTTTWRLPRPLLAVSLGVLTGTIIFVWLISGHASVRATFNLPILSPQPCVAMTTFIALLGLARGVARSRRRGPGLSGC